jgi:UDP-N-acetylglucosamine 3-dehydrogenase
LERRIHVAIVGTGRIAEAAHIPAYLSNKYAEIVAIVDTDSKQLTRTAKKFRVKKTFSSVDDLLDNEKIDAISICTPPNTHSEICLKGLQHNVNILCEKPLATDVDSGKRMVAASRSKRKILMVGYHRRFLPNYQKAKKYILNGNLGHVYCVEDHFLEPNPLLNYSKSRWFFKPNIGGVLLDIAPHVFDMLNYIFNDFPVAISARSFTYLDQPVEDCCVFVVEYPNGRVGIGTTSWLSSTVIENLNVYGTAQNLFVSPDFFLRVNPTEIRQIALLRAACESLVGSKFPNLPIVRTKTVNPYQLEIDYFIDRIRKDMFSSESALNGLSVLITSEMAKRAIEKNCRIDIPHPENL